MFFNKYFWDIKSIKEDELFLKLSGRRLQSLEIEQTFLSHYIILLATK